VIDPKEVKLAFTDTPPFKGLLYPFGRIEVHLGVKENLK
jgi:hypothetical protein